LKKYKTTAPNQKLKPMSKAEVPSRTVLKSSRHIGQIIAFYKARIYLTPPFWVNRWALHCKIRPQRTRHINLSHGAQHISIHWTV